MDGTMNSRPIEQITQEIGFYKQQAGACLIEIGTRLNEAKEQLGHGDWIPWLRDKAGFSERTAQNLMKIAREYRNPQLVSDLGMKKSVLLLALESGEREEFISAVHMTGSGEKTVMDMSAEELKKQIAELKKTKEEADRELEQMKLDLQAAQEESQDAQRELDEERRDAEAKAKADAEKAEADAERYNQRIAGLEKQLQLAREEASQPDEDMMAEIRKKAATEEAEKLQRKINKVKEDMRKAESDKKQAEEILKQAIEEKEAAVSARSGLEERLAKAEEQAARAEKKLAESSDPLLAEFRVRFDGLKNSINELFALIDQEEDDAKKEKMHTAMKALMSQVMEVHKHKNERQPNDSEK